MRRRVPGVLSSAAVIAAVLCGCALAAPTRPDGPQPASAGSSPTASAPTAPAPTGDASGALTGAAVAAAAPGWEPSPFTGFVEAPDGHVYGGDCRASAWDVLSLTEAATRVARTFRTTTEAEPRPHLTLGVVALPPEDRQRDLDALDHQFSSCVGEGPDGVVRQLPLTVVPDWSGLHQVGGDRDLYWAPYGAGIVLAQLDPGADQLDEELVRDLRAILAAQLAELE